MTDMRTNHRGDCTYLPESDLHFPHLTVAQTLQFAAQARLKSECSDSSGSHSILRSASKTATSLGLDRVLTAKVGNSFLRGISGGERKRTSIAEVIVGRSTLQCWDNSTRGLDSANALQFVRTLRSSAQAN